MISKGYYSNWLKEAGRGHLAAVLSWGAFLFYLMGKLSDLMLGTDDFYFGIASTQLLWLCAALGIALAFIELFYLFQEKKQDFYFSLPVKKSTIFWSRYVHGILHFMIPFLITQGVCAAASAMKAPGFLPYAWQYLYRSVGVFTAAFLLFYHIGILAAVVSGRFISAVLTAALIVFGGQILFEDILPGLAKCFFASFYRIPFLEDIAAALAPFTLMVKLGGIGLKDREEVLNYLPPGHLAALAAVWILLLLAAGICAHRNRKTETTGRMFTSAAAERSVETIASCLFGLWLGKLVVTLSGAAGNGFFENGAARGAVLLSGVGMISAFLVHLFIEWLVLMPKKTILRRKGQLALEGALVCGTAIFFMAARNPFDSYTPEISQTESISVSLDGIDMGQGEYEMIQTMDNYLTDVRLRRFVLEEKGKEEALDWIGKVSRHACSGEIGEEEAVTKVTVCFQIQDGECRYRTYPVSRKLFEDFAGVYETEEYKRKAYPLTAENGLDKERFTWSDGVTETVMKLTKEEKNDFLVAYQYDVMKMKMMDMEGIFPSGIVRVQAEGRGVHSSAVVYPFFEKSIGFLKGHGILTDKGLEEYEVASIQVQKWARNSQTGVDFYTEEKEVAAWTESLVPEELCVQPILCPVDASVRAGAEAEDESTGSAVIVKCYGRRGKK